MSKSNDVFEDNSNDNEQVQDSKRRFFVTKTTTVTATAIATAITTMTGNPSASMAGAMARRSRTDGYEVQKPESEWQSMLSPVQYDVLRNGGTERPYSSILEGEERPGIYVCAGCGTPLFDSKEKFHSGTGWPSFARGISPGVEIEDVNAATLNLVGAELRCKTCGGHLGDVFADGILFVGTPAFTSGKRYCIDGAALAFVPQDGSDPVMGDKSPLPVKKSEPSWLSPPKINAK